MYQMLIKYPVLIVLTAFLTSSVDMYVGILLALITVLRSVNVTPFLCIIILALKRRL